MGRNLGPLNIKDSYEGLVQISGSQLTDGSGSLISSLEVTASDATSATSASYAVTADSATSASYATTATSASHAVQADSADSATTASYVETAQTASYVSGANVDGVVASATSASHAVQADSATTADTATSASFATTASYAENATTPDLQQVLDEGSVATGSIELYDVAENESILLNYHSAGGAVYSGRGNSILNLGVNQTGQRDLISLGGNASVGFYGVPTNNFNNEYSWFKTKGWISGSLAVQQALTASGLIYPTTDGTSGQVVTTDGLGNLTFTTVSGGGGADAGLISGSAPNSLASANYTTTDALAEGSGSIAIGDNAQVTGSTSDNSIVIGKDADSKENSVRNVVIGYNAFMTEANRNDSVIIGANANGYQEGVAVGADTFAIFGAVALGRYAYTNDNYGVAIGYGARTNNTSGISIGSGSLQDGNYSIAIGHGAHATASGDLVINNGYTEIYTYQSASNTTTLEGILAIDGIANVSASIAAGGGAAFPFTGSAGITGSLDVVGPITREEGGFSGSVVDNITDTYTGSSAVNHVVSLTQAEYDAIGTPDVNTLYYITDAAAGGAFPYTGDAEITGSLDIDGWFKVDHLGVSGSDERNLAIGTGSLANITSGVRNTAIGSYYLDNPGSNLFAAGYQITSGNDNTFYGVGAGTRLTTGQNNTAIGVLALGGTTTGTDNVGIGGQALRDNNGTANIGIGKWAGYNASGQNGVMIGHRTGFVNTGWRNIIIGANCVGQGGTTLSTHDKLVIGQDVNATDNLIYGFHGPDTTAGDRFLTIKGLINAGQYSAAPTGAGVQAGSIYYDTTLNKLRCYDGTSWNNLF